jgi:hypothetical protein
VTAHHSSFLAITMDQFWAAPPVTRTLTALTFLQSILVHGGLLSGYYVLFLRRLVFKTLPEIWRLFSPFMITGPGLSLIFDLYFMFTYGSRLETESPRFSAPGDFFTYVSFVASIIMVSSGNIPVSSASDDFDPRCLPILLCAYLCYCCHFFFSSVYLPPRISARPAQHQLKRFLETREIAPASRIAPQLIFTGAICVVGMVGRPVR